MLLTACVDGAEVTIENASMWIDRHAEAEVARTVVVVAVKPGAVVNIRIGAGGMRDGLWCLVDRIVVESIEQDSVSTA